jgi:DNA-binding transcriptional regulator YiaG
MMSKLVASKLKLARQKLELTQEGMAEKLGVPSQTLISWEQDRRTPRGLALTALNQRLDKILASKS